MGIAIRDLLIEALRGSGGVELSAVCLDQATELFELQDEQVVQAFSAQAAHEVFAKCICLWGLRGCLRISMSLAAAAKC